jgi:hypothetical protein
VAKEQVAKEQVAKEQVAKEQVAKEQVANKLRIEVATRSRPTPAIGFVSG